MFKDCSLSELLSYGVAKSYLRFDVTDFFLPLPLSALMLMAVNYCDISGKEVITQEGCGLLLFVVFSISNSFLYL